jgi:hypothetical protein
MSAADIAAWIGAAAWLVPIGQAVHRYVTRPVVTILPDEWARIGFTSGGPGLNLRLVFSADRRAVIVDGLEVSLRHEGGEEHRLRWSYLDENLSQIEDQSGVRSFVTRPQTPIAIKVNTYDLPDKFVRFIEPGWQDVGQGPAKWVRDQVDFHRKKPKEGFVERMLASKELFDAIDARKRFFWWRPGLYYVNFHLSSPERFRYADITFSFDLSQESADALQRNVSVIEGDWEGWIRSFEPGHATYVPPAGEVWVWPFVRVRKVA